MATPLISITKSSLLANTGKQRSKSSSRLIHLSIASPEQVPAVTQPQRLCLGDTKISENYESQNHQIKFTLQLASNAWSHVAHCEPAYSEDDSDSILDNNSSTLQEVTARLGQCVKEGGSGGGAALIKRGEKNGVIVYGIKENKGRFEGGLSVARVGCTTIQAPPSAVAQCWWDFNKRKSWDHVNTTHSETLQELVPNQEKLVHLKAKGKPMISPRDFVFVSHRVPPAEVGATSPGSQLFVQTNSPGALEAKKGAVRGDVNSMLLVEPHPDIPLATLVTYVVEMDAKGWIPTYAVSAAADDLPMTLAVMREHLEAGA
eukprot:CAMPEP_0113950802 /NCGR_PEP_ID=MMETSP1339-20121228/82603_1 /TAXON_ID=94617 /ORGANISM="Fibrocapsa japonica" /LENGTH=316 /DNA_ID=CAMNT_0000958773 /DNA_START=27 /DNA_END=977 /DNA_ORIENTATION=- /assembly_acc=CAM_ASM_000762